MVLSVWYPVYDSKHWFSCCRFGNGLGAYLVLYAPLAAASELHRSLEEARSMSLQTPHQADVRRLALHDCLDLQQALLLTLSIAMLLWQGSAATFCWASPATWLMDKLDQQDQFFLWFSRKYKPVVVWGIDLIGAIAILVVTEISERSKSQPLLEKILAVDVHRNAPEVDALHARPGRCNLCRHRYRMLARR